MNFSETKTGLTTHKNYLSALGLESLDPFVLTMIIIIMIIIMKILLCANL